MKKIIFLLLFLSIARFASCQMVHFYIINANTGEELTSKNGVSIFLSTWIDYAVRSSGGSTVLGYNNYLPRSANYSVKYMGSSEKKGGTSFYVPKLGIESQSYFAFDLKYVKSIACEVKAKGYKTSTAFYPPTSSHWGNNEMDIIHSVTQNGKDINFEIALLPIIAEIKK